MEQCEIIKGNKLIAEFMGLEFRKTAKGMPDIKYRHNFTQHGFYEETHEGMLLFNSSWDWLMPVVEKIMDICEHPTKYMGCNSFYLGITSFNIKMEANRKYTEFNSYFIKQSSRIEGVYKVVVEFINWYNVQNQ